MKKWAFELTVILIAQFLVQHIYIILPSLVPPLLQLGQLVEKNPEFAHT
ncbi:hypothetical protein [Litchfieldia alkalitelluris]|nr:hypothetical protein [Litchfieldia alkalitelluris]